MAPAGKDIWSWCLILPSSFSCLISTVLFPSLLQLFVYSYLTFGNPKIPWLHRRKKILSEDCRQFKTTLHHSNLRYMAVFNFFPSQSHISLMNTCKFWTSFDSWWVSGVIVDVVVCREWLWSIYLQPHFHKHLTGYTATFCRYNATYHSLSTFSPNCIFFAFCIQSLLGVKCLSSIKCEVYFLCWMFDCLKFLVFSASRRGVAYLQALGLVLKCAAFCCTEGCTNLSIKSQWGFALCLLYKNNNRFTIIPLLVAIILSYARVSSNSLFPGYICLHIDVRVLWSTVNKK